MLTGVITALSTSTGSPLVLPLIIVAQMMSLLSFLKLPEVLVLLLGLPIDRPALLYALEHSKMTLKILKSPKLEMAESSKEARSTIQTRKTANMVNHTSYCIKASFRKPDGRFEGKTYSKLITEMKRNETFFLLEVL
jgi:hypothetical protein